MMDIKCRTQLKITIIQVQSFKVQECGSNGGQERGAYQVSDSCGGGDKLVDNDDDGLGWVAKKMFLPASPKYFCAQRPCHWLIQLMWQLHRCQVRYQINITIWCFFLWYLISVFFSALTISGFSAKFMAFNWDTHGASLAILPIDAQGQQNKQIIKTYENKKQHH